MARPKSSGRDVARSAEEGHQVAILFEMIGLAAANRCMACGWPLDETKGRGCVLGECSFRPSKQDEAYSRWSQRTMILILAKRPFQVK